MRRQSTDTESLVYAYGCGEPTDGFNAAMAEDARIRALWDRLVRIDREYESRVLASACADDEQLASIVTDFDLRRAMPRVADDDWPAERKLRRDLEAQTWPLLSAWRKGHVDVLREHDQWRRDQVILARQESGCYWGNYNAVIQRYETARTEVRKRGRRLQFTDLARDNGCLTVQIQRTASGLGAAPRELQDGSCSQIQIGLVPDSAYDPETFRGDRRRGCRTVVQMRIDAAGSMITLPVWMHRRLPDDCRIKAAQIVWRSDGHRRRYGLRLTISRPKVERFHPHPDSMALVTVDIAPRGRGLMVARIEGHADLDAVVLDEHWLSMMDRVDYLQSVIGNEGAGDLARIRARLERPGLWRRLRLRRREMYRLIARDLCLSHGSIVIATPALSEAAWAGRGTEASFLRHRACAHELIAELRHQAAKCGCLVEMRVAAASAAVPRRVRNRQADASRSAAAAQLAEHHSAA